MILIISEERDASTNIILLWLKKYNVKYFRINSMKVLLNSTICLESEELILHDKKIRISEIKVIWLRRIPMYLKKENLLKFLEVDSKINSIMQEQAKLLLRSIFDFSQIALLLDILKI